MQSHKCAYLVPRGDECHGDKHCQYKMVLQCNPDGLVFCGKDQIIAIQADREPEFDGSEITIGGA